MNGTLRYRNTTRNLERAENPTKRPHSYLKIAWKNVSLWDRNSVNPQLKAPSPACLLPPLLCSQVFTARAIKDTRAAYVITTGQNTNKWRSRASRMRARECWKSRAFSNISQTNNDEDADILKLLLLWMYVCFQLESGSLFKSGSTDMCAGWQ